jgi:formylglycine-generating enzyme required for sulfatase activity
MAGKALAALTLAGLAGLAVTAGATSKWNPPEPPGGFIRISRADNSAFAIGRYEVTWREWKACHDDRGCSTLPRPGHGLENAIFPVTGVNRFDVEEYLAWLNAKSGLHYRLPTAAEWNIVSNALSRRPAKKRFSDPRLAWAADYGSMDAVPAAVRPSGSFGTAANGISDLSGNVWEWTATCAAEGMGDLDCPAYLAEGLHEAPVSVFIRNPATGGCAIGTPPANIGFRLALDN